MTFARAPHEDKSRKWTAGRSVRVYLDDIEELLRIGADVGGFVAESREFASSAPLESAGELRVGYQRSISGLHLRSSDSSVSVSIGWKSGVSVRPADDPRALGVFYEIQRILERCQVGLPHRVLLWMNYALLPTPLLTGLFALSYIRFSSHLFSVSGVASALVILSVAVALSMAAFKLIAAGFRVNDSIILTSRAESPTFLERHRAEMVIGLVTNLLVGFIFFVLGAATND